MPQKRFLVLDGKQNSILKIILFVSAHKIRPLVVIVILNATQKIQLCRSMYASPPRKLQTFKIEYT